MGFASVAVLPWWVVFWLAVTAIVCTWDASFIMLRPRSLPGGDLNWLWYPYRLYVHLDQRYGDLGDAYVFAQSLMNYVEVIMNIVIIYMCYKGSKHTAPLTFTVSVMTFWKTVLYFLMLSEFCTGGEYRKGNDPLEELFLVAIPNGVWLVMPFLVMWQTYPSLMLGSSGSYSNGSIDAKKRSKFPAAINNNNENGYHHTNLNGNYKME